jgi:SHS2 domain-containing protein
VAPGFELLEHTADVAVRSWGERPHDVFEQAALGMVSLIYDVRAVAPREERHVALSGMEPELTLAAWLNDILYLIEAEAFLGHEFRVDECPSRDETRPFAAGIKGEADPARSHHTRAIVKAATLHGISVRCTSDGWEGYVLLDV